MFHIRMLTGASIWSRLGRLASQGQTLFDKVTSVSQSRPPRFGEADVVTFRMEGAATVEVLPSWFGATAALDAVRGLLHTSKRELVYVWRLPDNKPVFNHRIQRVRKYDEVRLKVSAYKFVVCNLHQRTTNPVASSMCVECCRWQRARETSTCLMMCVNGCKIARYARWNVCIWLSLVVTIVGGCVRRNVPCCGPCVSPSQWPLFLLCSFARCEYNS